MATVDKNFRVKNGLVVEGTTGTINGEDIITADKITGGTQTNITVTYSDGNINFVAEDGNYTAGTGISISESNEISVDRTTTDTWYDEAGAAATAESNANAYTDQEILTAVGQIPESTDDLAEGITNLYFTGQRVRDELSGGDGIDFDNGTGVISALLGTGLKFDGTREIEIDDSVVATNTNVTTAIETHSDLTTGVHGVTGDVVGTSDAQTLTNKTMGDDLLMDGNQISGLGTPTQSDHAATKLYVDEVAQGIKVRGSVEAATTADLGGTYANGSSGVDSTITIPATATLDIDGWTSWSVGDGILVKDQTNAEENGRYFVSVVGDVGTAWVLKRCIDCDTAEEIPGSFVFVQHGTSYEATGWVATVDNVDTFTVGTDDINWVQFSGAGTYLAGNGLTLTGNEFAIDTTITATRTFATGEVTTHNNLDTGVHGVTGDVVGTSDTQTLTGKTISGSDNTLSNIGNSSLTNSAVTVNGTSVSLGGSVTLDADDIDDSATTNKFFTDELAVDAVAAAIAAGTQTNITITYDDENGTLSFNSAGASIIDTDVTFTSVEINSVAKQVAATQTVTTAGQVVAHSFAHAEFTSAEYFVKVTDGTDSEVSKVLLTLDSSNNIAITEYGNVQSNGSLSSISAGINGTDVELLVTTTTNNSDVMVSGTLLV
jgi:hypothetical protein